MEEVRDNKLLFPPYLEKGSIGPAVFALQVMGKTKFLGVFSKVICDGIFGDETEAAVKLMQEHLGFTTDDEVDGRFGSKTRAALNENCSINVESWLRSEDMETTVVRTVSEVW